jgi:hypothetical protein
MIVLSVYIGTQVELVVATGLGLNKVFMIILYRYWYKDDLVLISAY